MKVDPETVLRVCEDEGLSSAAAAVRFGLRDGRRVRDLKARARKAREAAGLASESKQPDIQPSGPVPRVPALPSLSVAQKGHSGQIPEVAQEFDLLRALVEREQAQDVARAWQPGPISRALWDADEMWPERWVVLNVLLAIVIVALVAALR